MNQLIVSHPMWRSVGSSLAIGGLITAEYRYRSWLGTTVEPSAWDRLMRWRDPALSELISDLREGAEPVQRLLNEEPAVVRRLGELPAWRAKLFADPELVSENRLPLTLSAALTPAGEPVDKFAAHGFTVQNNRLLGWVEVAHPEHRFHHSPTDFDRRIGGFLIHHPLEMSRIGQSGQWTLVVLEQPTARIEESGIRSMTAEEAYKRWMVVRDGDEFEVDGYRLTADQMREWLEWKELETLEARGEL